MSKRYHTVIRRAYKEDGLIREDFIRREDDYYMKANYLEKYYADYWGNSDVVVINQFVTEEE